MTDATLRLVPVQHVRTAVLDVAYVEEGPHDGDPVILVHGFPHDIHGYAEVMPALVEDGLRVIVPYLRGHGPTRFLDSKTPRSGQQAAHIVTASATPGAPPYEDLERLLARQPVITVPAVTLDGLADGNYRLPTGARPPPASRDRACTGRCPTPGTTCHRRCRRRSSTQSSRYSGSLAPRLTAMRMRPAVPNPRGLRTLWLRASRR